MLAFVLLITLVGAAGYAGLAMRLHERGGPSALRRLLLASVVVTATLATALWTLEGGEAPSPQVRPPFTPLGSWLNYLLAYTGLLVVPSALVVATVQSLGRRPALVTTVATASGVLGVVLWILVLLPRSAGL